MTGKPRRIGLLFRGDRSGPPLVGRAQVLAEVFEAFHEIGVEAEPVVYSDDAVDEVRNQLHGLDGVLVWVNPIQDEANRAVLDQLLRDVATDGLFVSAHPNVIKKLGTKAVLHRTKDLGWGTDTALYASPSELAQRFPHRLANSGVGVVKQGRGNGGNGVWRVERLEPDSTLGPEATVRVQHAQTMDAATKDMTLGEFLDRCAPYFAWSGFLIDQPYQSRPPDGLIRCYLVHNKVVGFQHQWPRGLLDAASLARLDSAPPAKKMETADTAQYQPLRSKLETEWVPQMQELLCIDTLDLPVIWDADFLYGPKNAAGDDTHVLCEVNVSAVWPFPPQATRSLADAAAARLHA